MTDAGFPKQSRLLSPKEFSPVFDSPDFRLSCRYLLLLARHSDEDQGRLGIVVGKRHIRKAVQRNRIKRILRESFRVMKNDFATIDLVFLARSQLDGLDNKNIHAEIERLLKQLVKQLKQTRDSKKNKPGALTPEPVNPPAKTVNDAF